MSYDIHIQDPETGRTIELDEKHNLTGGTFELGGTTKAWLNITYNYSKFFCGTINAEVGIRALYGKTGCECIPILEAAIKKLGIDASPDYWEASRGNAGAALANLLELIRLCPDGIINGD